MSEATPVRVEEHGDHAVIRIERHVKRNAMSRAARAGLQAALRQVEGRFPAVVLTARRPASAPGST
jgi:enoyl-CoA hydratase/carnithine racemase